MSHGDRLETGVRDREQCNYAMLCHLAAFLPPPLQLLGPWILWRWKRDEMPLVDQQGREVLDFQLSILLYAVAATPLLLVGVGLLLLPAIWIFGVVQSILGAIHASEGRAHHYPLSLRLLR